jgi:transcriptional regulator with XRE-family HTH domain
VDDIRVGLVFRAVRRAKGLRQADVAVRAGLSQQFVSDLERGRVGHMLVRCVRSVGAALEIEMPFGPRWRGPELDRLLDADHATIVGGVVAYLRQLEWTVLVEWSFNHYGERGSIDIVAWHPQFRALVVIEVKTSIVDLQDLLATQDRKVRIATTLLPREQGWRPAHVARIVVLADGSTTRSAVARHRSVLDAVLPARTVAIKGWLLAPKADIAGIWFFPFTAGAGAMTRRRSR